MDWNYRVNSFEYFAERLAEPWLIERSVAFGDSLAVPIGKLRRGGELGYFEGRWWRRSAERCVEELKAFPGFPRLRIDGRAIRWGDDLPTSNWRELMDLDDGSRASELRWREPYWRKTLTEGCYYGYKTTAIIDIAEDIRGQSEILGPISRRELIRLIRDARKGVAVRL
jgi:hypothetical protein